MSQPTLDGMPERLYAAAPARLATWIDCPRRYRLTYLDRPAPVRTGAWAHTSAGATVHSALARWWDLPPDRRTPEAGGALVTSGWPGDGFRDPRQSHAARRRAVGHVERYLAGVDPSVEPLAVERTVSVHTAHGALWGRVDRLDARGDGVAVVDYKTGRHVPTAEEARDSLALAVYAAGAARMLHRPCRRVELHHLPSGTIAAWDHTEASLSAHLRRADDVAAELARLDDAHPEGGDDAAFPARVAPRCGWCDVRPSCPEGRAVPARRPWDGITDA